MPVKVSVVVPVYNPGEFIDPLINSLLGQTMSSADYEVVFVNDGSTDETPEKLERLAGEHDHVKVLHIPNSGWPGRPRNVGIDNSVGEYIQFVDHDDELAPEALERLHAYALENDSDVVVGKEVRRRMGWGVLGSTFDKNRPRASLRSAPLLTVMTPHKMFRRRLLDKHHIRFFEGPRRMEDHPFVLEAYFRADVVSVLADQPIYYWNRRPDQGNAGAQAFEWERLYLFMRDTLDVIERLAEPDSFRDRLLAFYYDSKGLGMLSRSVRTKPHDAVRTHFDALRELVEERFPPAVDAHLKGVVRARSQLLRADDFDGFVALAQLEHGVRPYVELKGLSVDEEARLRIQLRAGLVDSSGSPLVLNESDGRFQWRPPLDLEAVSTDAFDVTSAYRNKRIELALRNRATSEVFLVGGTVEPPLAETGEVSLMFDATFVVDPEDVAFGRPLERGGYDIFARVGVPPWRRQARLPSLPEAAEWGPVGVAVATERSVVPFTTHAGNLAIDVNQTYFSIVRAASFAPHLAQLNMDGGRATLSIPLPGLRTRNPHLTGRLRLSSETDDTVVRAPLRIMTDSTGQAVARARLALSSGGDAAGITPGRWRVIARVNGRRADLDMVLEVSRGHGLRLMTTSGEVVARIERLSVGRLSLDRLRSALARTRRALRRWQRSAVGRGLAHTQMMKALNARKRTP